MDVTRSGGDVVKAFRKLKRMYKDGKFFEEMRERQVYVKPSARKREAGKERAKILKNYSESVMTVVSWGLENAKNNYYFW